jgi:hypothetical protein
MGHPDNYIRADALITPTHIVPEWYFLRAPLRLLDVYCLYLAVCLACAGIKTPDLSDSEKIGKCSMSGKGQPTNCYVC